MALSGAQEAELSRLLEKFEEYTEETRERIAGLSNGQNEQNMEVNEYKSLVIKIETLMQKKIFNAPTLVQDQHKSEAYDGDDEKSSQDSDVKISGSSKRQHIRKIK